MLSLSNSLSIADSGEGYTGILQGAMLASMTRAHLTTAKRNEQRVDWVNN